MPINFIIGFQTNSLPLADLSCFSLFCSSGLLENCSVYTTFKVEIDVYSLFPYQHCEKRSGPQDLE